eukprot:scaffold23476_cov125-Cylindrotheca_fusiformis.AAC.13
MYTEMISEPCVGRQLAIRVINECNCVLDASQKVSFGNVSTNMYTLEPENVPIRYISLNQHGRKLQQVVAKVSERATLYCLGSCTKVSQRLAQTYAKYCTSKLRPCDLSYYVLGRELNMHFKNLVFLKSHVTLETSEKERA